MTDTKKTDNRGATSRPATGFSIGDSVTWTHSSSSGSGYNFSTRSGKIEKITGKWAKIRMRNNRRTEVPVARLRKRGERTELTELFMGEQNPEAATDAEAGHTPEQKDTHGQHPNPQADA